MRDYCIGMISSRWQAKGANVPPRNANGDGSFLNRSSTLALDGRLIRLNSSGRLDPRLGWDVST
jgi:hypothetical protein